MIERYIEQLLEDIRYSEEYAEKRLMNFKKVNDLEADCLFDEEIESFGIKLSDLFEMDKMFFPEKKMLDVQQMSQLVDAMESLWRSYGLNPVFPEDIPVEVKYCQLRDHLDHVTMPVPGKIMDVELCDYLPEYCPFFNWCPLAQIYNSNKCHTNHEIVI
jgi:hypothetical protein